MDKPVATITDRPEPAYEKYAWVLLLIPEIISLWVASGGLNYYRDYLRTTDFLLFDSVLGVGFPLLALALSLIPYRRGEKWSWYALWTFPLLSGIAASLNLSSGRGDWGFFAFLSFLSLLGLLLPYRKFFPRKQA